MSGGSSTPTTQTQTQKVEPWDAAKPYYEDLYKAAQTAYGQVDKTPYTGPLYAAPNATQQQALAGYTAAAGNVNTTPTAPITGVSGSTTAGANALNAEALKTLNGGYMPTGPVTANPYLSDAISAATTPIYNQLMRQVLPGLQDQSIAQGAFGGSGYGTAQGLATSDFTQQALNLGGQLSYQSYEAEAQRRFQAEQAERNRQAQAGSLLGQALGLSAADISNQTAIGGYNAGAQANNNNLALLPSQLLDKAGQQQQTWDQSAIQAALQRYNINQAAPFAGLGEFAQILNGGGFSSAGSTSSAPGSNGTASFLQGAAGAAGIASSLFPSATQSAGNWLSNLFSGGGGGSGGMSASDLASLLANGS